MEAGARTDGAAGRVPWRAIAGWRSRVARNGGAREFRSAMSMCDFESYVTDLTDGKTWTAQHAHSLKQAKLSRRDLCANTPARPKRDCYSWALQALEKRILRLRR